MKKWLTTQLNSNWLFYGTLLCATIATIDYLTGYALNVAFFYFFPILWVTWKVGIIGGIFLSLLSSFLWFVANLLTRSSDISLSVHYWNTGIRLGTFTGVASLLAMLKKSKEREFLAKIDSLTGAGNLRYFLEEAQREVRRARRYHRPLSIAYLDLDNFKRVNDTLGHSTGDEVLCTVVRTLNENIRSSDILARLGGDEFVLLFPETGYESFNGALQKIHKMLLEGMQRNHWPITFTVGAVTFGVPPESTDDILKIVDGVMYSAKKSGKNKIHHENYETEAKANDLEVGV